MTIIIVRNHLISTSVSRCLCSRTPLARFLRIQLGHNTEQTLTCPSLVSVRLCYAEGYWGAGFEVIRGHDTFGKSKQKWVFWNVCHVYRRFQATSCLTFQDRIVIPFKDKNVGSRLVPTKLHARRHTPEEYNLNVIQSYHLPNMNFKNLNRNFENELIVNFG